jgi:PLP dependent protein
MIAENIEKIRTRIAGTCKRIGKNPDEICVIVVTKTILPDKIIETYNTGQKIFGENKVQELLTKIDKVPGDIQWHMIGHLQKNKVKFIAGFIDIIHSVDSYELALEINKYAEKFNRTIPILIQVNTSGEISKFGIEPDKTIELVEEISVLKNVKIIGLMTIGMFSEDPEIVRPCFKLLRNLKEDIIKSNIENVEMNHLSMGMTNDFEVAIEEGATMIRIGTAVFGDRY